MTRIAHLLKKWIKRMAMPFAATKNVATKVKAPALEKEWSDYSAKKVSKTLVSDQQRELLHHFIHYHSEN